MVSGGRRKVVTKADLRKRGYPKKKIDKVKWKLICAMLLKLARENPVSGYDSSGDSFLQPELETTLTLRGLRRNSGMYEGEEAVPWRIVYAGDVLFEKEQVDEDPFVEFNPFASPHTVWGNSYAGRVKQTQNARTALTAACSITPILLSTLVGKWCKVGWSILRKCLIAALAGLCRPLALMPFVLLSILTSIRSSIRHWKC